MKKLCVTVTLLIVVTVTVYATFFQGFEANTDGWFGASRVASGTHSVPSKTGVYHAEDANGNVQTFTYWGGVSETFPPVGTPPPWTSTSISPLPT